MTDTSPSGFLKPEIRLAPMGAACSARETDPGARSRWLARRPGTAGMLSREHYWMTQNSDFKRGSPVQGTAAYVRTTDHLLPRPTGKRSRWCPDLQTLVRRHAIDHRRVQDCGNDLHLTAADRVVLRADLKNLLEQQRIAHANRPMVRAACLALSRWRSLGGRLEASDSFRRSTEDASR